MSDLGIFLNCAYKKEHFPDIEQFNQTVKERVQSAGSSMPFKNIYKLMIVHIVISAIFWLNDFPLSKPGAGLSKTKGPKQLFLGTVVD